MRIFTKLAWENVGGSGINPNSNFWGNTANALLNLLNIVFTLLLIAGFCLMAYGVYEFIQSFAIDTVESRKKALTTFFVGLILVSAERIVYYIIWG